MASQQQVSNTPLPVRDSWQTPDWLFWWADQRFDFDFDLAADENNRKCNHFFSLESDALSQEWFDYFPYGSTVQGWCNPPYSKPSLWLEKAWYEAEKGFRCVFLVPTPNGENYWRDHVFGKASEIIFINGRVAFELPNGDGTATPVTGNTRGSCLVIYNRRYEGHTQMSYVNRDDMIKEYKEAMK